MDGKFMSEYAVNFVRGYTVGEKEGVVFVGNVEGSGILGKFFATHLPDKGSSLFAGGRDDTPLSRERL